MNDVRTNTPMEGSQDGHVDEGENQIELYVAEDIIQGEDIPFFILWKGEDVSSIELSFEGFESISRLYNVMGAKELEPTKPIPVERLRVPGYLGGVLATELTEEPYRTAQLQAVIRFSSGEPRVLVKDTVLHTTRVQVLHVPESIQVPIARPERSIDIQLDGITTVIINLETLEGSEIELVLPKEIMSAMEKFGTAVIDGFNQLRDEFPEHTKLLDRIVDVPENISIRQYTDEMFHKFEEVKNDRSFIEAMAMVFVAAFFDQASVKDSLYYPLMEYLEANAAHKAYLRSPFLCADVPAGGGVFSARLKLLNLLMEPCGDPVVFETRLDSPEDNLVSIKDIIAVRRL